ncbi:condensin-2 complex subunit H2 isoform X2 [Plutella xylostella]|uniref:condensin-2 complex subunit H2 isoform X2 n=1 Tax=Plutella xylostella TaxID=51655 RepID=UPI002032E9D4|nr:condensin-2 complex subunit H2 isoform X2 [Plutella xylostella]
MATVVITFFLIGFYEYKMDADFDETPRDLISRREKRWSMNSQRLEEIVAELMKPISDARRSFDTDLSALLEEYLTEAGLHALEEEDGGLSTHGAPNYAELALLLQQSACIYGRKVDFLYQHVLSVSDSLQTHTHDEPSTSEEVSTPAGSRRRRKVSTSVANFEPLELTPASSATREADTARPPPTLPRLYLELEPRVMTSRDCPLTDYNGEPIGLLQDFHVTWRLHNGFLIEGLKNLADGMSQSVRPVPLQELQAAIEAVAPPPPSTPPPMLPPIMCEEMSPPPCASTPIPAMSEGELQMLERDETENMPPPSKRRKRNQPAEVIAFVGCVKMTINKKGRRALCTLQDFSLPPRWVSSIVQARREEILATRQRLRELQPDEDGFMGWSRREASATAVDGPDARESDDDGFFEQSSLGDSDASRVDDTAITTIASTTMDTAADWAAWRAGVVARAEQQKAVDVRVLADRVLRALPPPTEPASTPLSDMLRDTAEDPLDVSKLFLATLFLANAGNIEIVQGAPLSVNSASLRVLSLDQQRVAAVAEAEDAPAPAPAAPCAPRPPARRGPRAAAS